MVKVALDSTLGPNLQVLAQQLLDTLGLETERVSTQIDAILPIIYTWYETDTWSVTSEVRWGMLNS